MLRSGRRRLLWGALVLLAVCSLVSSQECTSYDPKALATPLVTAALSRCRGGGSSPPAPKLPQRPRRGLLAFFRRKSADQVYREALEEQIQLMERQIRSARDEAAQLRKLIKDRGTQSRKESSGTVRKELTTVNELREEVSRLLKRIEDLEKTKEELATLLEIERKRVEEQAKLLELERKKMGEKENKSKEEMEKLRATLMEQTKRQLEELERSAEKRVDEEKRRQQLEADDRVKAERLKGQEAVEEEKVKMRKLVKALAEKEKKELKKAEEKQKAKKKADDKKPVSKKTGKKKEKSKTIISGNSRSGSTMGKAKAPGATVRGSTGK